MPTHGIISADENTRSEHEKVFSCSETNVKRISVHEVWGVAAIALVFAASIAAWFAVDSRVPTTDEAGHILNALDYKELFHHARPFKLHWWQQFLSVNRFYPPLVYILNGALKLALGNDRWVDRVSVMFFSVVLTSCTYAIAKMCSGSRAAAATSAVTVNLYPLVASMSHNFMLDFPLTSMIGAGVASLLWWQRAFTWRRAIVAALVVAGACMTKQIAAAYLLLPGLFAFAGTLKILNSRAIRQSGSSDTSSSGVLLTGANSFWSPGGNGASRGCERSPMRTAPLFQVCMIAAMVLFFVVPWICVNWQWIHGYSADTATTIQRSGVHLTPVSILEDYIVGLVYSMSPLLTVMFVVALCSIRADHKQLAPVYFSALGGLAFISTLTWTFPLDRYASGVLIATAVVTGCGARRLLGIDRWYAKCALVLLSILAVGQFVSFSFAPMPLDLPALSVLSQRMFVCLREFRGVRIDKATPYPGGLKWGQEWVLSLVKTRDGQAPVFLNILPSDGIFNPHSFELLAREKGLKLRPTTSRVWTIVGDDVKFSPQTAMYYQWYVLKTGGQGNQLKDEKAQFDYDRLIAFVKDPLGKFDLIGERQLPDGSMLSVYRQR